MKKAVIIALVTIMGALLLAGCKPAKELTLKAVTLLEDGRIHIDGRGRAFENTIGVKVEDEQGFVVYSGSTMTNAKDMSQFGDFSADLVLDYFPQTDNIKVTCFIASPKDGSITASESQTIAYSVPYKTVKVYFSNIKLNPEAMDCGKVFPVDRRISASDSNPAVSSLRFLMLGPSKSEKDDGYLAVTPSNLTINYIKTEGKKVKVDFGNEMFAAGGGSCRVTAIRAEITSTVQQFFEGYEVIISAEGNVEEVLQP